ncbi:MAG: DUF169 domain-containing protein [Actinomycetota bacterium]
MSTNWKALAGELSSLLGLENAPIAITHSESRPEGIPAFDEPMSEPAADGRRGRVAASCVFWMRAADRTFSTVAEDHGNCSVGRMTHGFATLEEVAGKDDVAALLESGWVGREQVPEIPTISTRPGAITYGPLAETPVEPDVVFLRLNPEQLMVLTDALPDLYIGAKPQCHILALAKERDLVAASVGCMLSRVRTGMSSSEMTCAIPAKRLTEVLDKLRAAESIDKTVAGYAAEDAQRFG